MNRNLMLSGVLMGALALSGCAGMTDTERRTATGATIAGAAVGLATGEWGWAAAGAAAGAAGGYLYDQNQKQQDARERNAYQRGVQAGKKGG